MYISIYIPDCPRLLGTFRGGAPLFGPGTTNIVLSTPESLPDMLAAYDPLALLGVSEASSKSAFSTIRIVRTSKS